MSKLSPTGNTLVYSTYLGGSNGEDGNAIAVDGLGQALLTGTTSSTNFPTVNPLAAPNNVLRGPVDAFVSKLNAAGNALVASTYLGGKRHR